MPDTSIVSKLKLSLWQERSTDDRHAERATRQYEQQLSDMLNSKK